MAGDNQTNQLAVVIGAGPAGLFAARLLAAKGVRTVLLNRDIKPGGLAEYGIFPSKLKMKEGLRKQFQQALDSPLIEYFGNVQVGQASGVSLSDLRALGFQAILVTAGAQGTKWLGLPGEDLQGVYHAKDLVYYYNHLPPFSQQKFSIGKRVALVGVGNVMIDIAHWLITRQKVDEVIAVARRGPADVKFTKKEMEAIICNLDIAALDAEMRRCGPCMQEVGQDPDAARAFIVSTQAKGEETHSHTRFRFDFLASPARMIGDKNGHVAGLEVDDTILVPGESEPQAKRVGTSRTIPVDTVIFCIGDRVDETFGLPVRRNEFVKNPNPRFPVDGNSYEAYDPDLERPIDRIFVAGWSREASHGLVGLARKDGENGARAVLAYLQTQPNLKNPDEILDRLRSKLDQLPEPVVTKFDLPRLAEVERQECQRCGDEEFQFDTNEAMLEAMGLIVAATEK